MPKRTAVHLIETLNCGGTENNLLRLLPDLEKAGWKTVLITLRGGGEMLPRFQAADVTVVELNQTNFLHPETVAKVAETINRYSPDIVITNLLRADILGRIFLGSRVKAPIISYLHTTYNHPRYRIARVFEWVTKRWARHYIANSVAVNEFYVSKLGVPQEKITTVAGGVDIESFQQARADGIRKELGLPNDAVVVTCVGNLAPNKGQASLIAAFEQVFANNPKAFLLLVGEGETRPLLEAQIQQSTAKTRIKLLGRRTDVANILKASTIFALPTLFEGLSVAILEAMAAGLAIVTTNIPENRVICTDQKSALLVEPASTEQLAAALTILRDHPERIKELGRAALASVRKDYAIDQFAPRFATVLTELCQAKP